VIFQEKDKEVKSLALDYDRITLLIST